MKEKELSQLDEIKPQNMSRMSKRAFDNRDWIPVGQQVDYSSFDLQRLQKLLWWLYRNNWLCANVIDNFTYLTFAGGFQVQWESTAKEEKWNKIAEQVRWKFRQREIMQACFAYGEWFTLLWPLSDPSSDTPQKIRTDLRGLDPWNVMEVVCEDGDPELVQGYRLDMEKVLPEWDVVHHRVKYLGNYKRGLPVCLPILDPLYYAEKYIGNIHWLYQIRSRVPMIWRVKGSPTDVDDEKARVGTTLPTPGTVWFQNEGATAEFPNLNLGSMQPIEVYRLFVLCASQGVGFPEFLVGASAEQSAYASLLVQKTPLSQKIRDFQELFRVDFRKLVIALTGDENFTIEIPPIMEDDIKAQVEAYTFLFDRGVLSKRTYAAKAGVEWDGEDGEKDRLANELGEDEGAVPGKDDVDLEFAVQAMRAQLLKDAKSNHNHLTELATEIMNSRGKLYGESFLEWIKGGANGS
jgi:hypothetical protein